jgi:chromosome segregation ATPase
VAEGAVVDRWEEGFDVWTPRGTGAAPDDTDVDLEREALLRLARELAERRHAEQQRAVSELDELKQSLRERAEAIAARERDLDRLEQAGRPKKREKAPAAAVAAEALLARERAALERAQALEVRARQLEERGAGLEAEAARLGEREQELAAELARAQAELGESRAERELASAERTQLEARAEETRRVEKELASRRIELERERDGLEARGREVEAREQALGTADPDDADPYAEREQELRQLEARLATRERELALMRQGLDAERNAVHDRERALRRREVVEVRQSFDAPLVPPSFGEGLAAFVSSRGRR